MQTTNVASAFWVAESTRSTCSPVGGSIMAKAARTSKAEILRQIPAAACQGEAGAARDGGNYARRERAEIDIELLPVQCRGSCSCVLANRNRTASWLGSRGVRPVRTRRLPRGPMKRGAGGQGKAWSIGAAGFSKARQEQASRNRSLLSSETHPFESVSTLRPVFPKPGQAQLTLGHLWHRVAGQCHGFDQIHGAAPRRTIAPPTNAFRRGIPLPSPPP